MFGPVSGAHFNPVVSFADAALGGPVLARGRRLPARAGRRLHHRAVAANLMFAQAAVSVSVKHRASGAHALSEVIATTGLILVIFALARSGRLASAPAAVGAYIGAAYWFTASTGFANPAIAVGRMFSNSFAASRRPRCRVHRRRDRRLHRRGSRHQAPLPRAYPGPGRRRRRPA